LVDVDQERLPVHSIDWHSANLYTQWYTQKTGALWRLPNELEWEKSARGVDGRFFPWGDFPDPSWACMRDSHQASRDLVSVDQFAIDESPYGVRGLGGNVIDWTSSVYQQSGPELSDGCISLEEREVDDTSEMVYKGGCWYFGSRFMRSADRHNISAQHRGNLIGFRMVCSVSELSTS
jgi:serine/threonine-protein kinase